MPASGSAGSDQTTVHSHSRSPGSARSSRLVRPYWVTPISRQRTRALGGGDQAVVRGQGFLNRAVEFDDAGVDVDSAVTEAGQVRLIVGDEHERAPLAEHALDGGIALVPEVLV